ncbi:hypothetical protein ACA910_021598 [Epithemia clementina (nom. ined.)]
MSKAFGTISIPESQNEKSSATTRSSKKSEAEKESLPGVVESLDTDSVMTFLSHLGVTQYEVHKRISDTLLKQLEDEIRKTKNDKPLLDLLSDSWSYAVTLPELRPIIWSVLKQLGEKTPHVVLKALAERDEDGSLKHAEIFRPLPALLKKLVWEGDWVARFPAESDQPPQSFLEECEKTLLHETIYPLVEQYCTNPMLVESANRPFVASIRERRMLTTQRRALTSSTMMEKAPTAAAAGLLGSSTAGGKTSNDNTARANARQQDNQSSSKAIAQLRVFLSDSGAGATTALSFRPKLLYALMTMLIARHGIQENPFLAGADYLHCTLVSDIMLSSGGPLPKAYHHVHELARIIDECVQEGSVSNDAIKNIQKALREIFLTDHDGPADTPKKDKEPTAIKGEEEPGSKKEEVSMTNALQRQLNHIITAGITALKESDPQSLFLNPVTDKIAPGYSKIIKQPMCILDMEHKIDQNEYRGVDEWKQEVELMFKNCHDYNKGKAGQWFRGEALRQKKIFEDEIFPQARRLYQTEIVKRRTEEEDRKRKAMAERPDISPLEKATKKRKKEKEEFLPSMPSLAFMILTDPFFVRIVVDRVLREARVSITNGLTVPAASFVVPSLLQLLHMARWSTQICAIRAKRYFVPSGGLQLSEASDSEDPAVFVPYATLRQDLPLVLRLMLEAELDKRIVSPAGDLHDAAKSDETLAPQPIESKEWAKGQFLEVPMTLMQSAIIHYCQPGSTTDASLAVTFPKFAAGLVHLSRKKFLQDRLFFQCLIRAIVRHKAKLSKAARDAIVKAWIVWLSPSKQHRKEKDKGAMVSAAHECLIQLLNEWSSIGNQVLPRDMLLSFVADAVKAVSASSGPKKDSDGEEERVETLADWWNKTEVEDDDTNISIAKTAASADKDAPFGPVKKQYLRMLKHLPEATATQWKEEMGISPPNNDDKDDDGDHEHGESGENDITNGVDEDNETAGESHDNDSAEADDEEPFTMEE